ncbi:MAG: ferredoxin [Archaeoglobus sp.]|nr:MAG: ferredoxin [Archaeoglobus sp.]
MVITESCVGCATCMLVCPADAIRVEGKAEINYELCKNCKKCVLYCPLEAINFVETAG